MKIAVATEEGKTISAHFGRSPLFAIFDIENGAVANITLRENTFTHHVRERQHTDDHGAHHHGKGDPHAHESVARGLGDCQVVISHGMGRRAWEDLRARGIEMIVTDETDVATAVRLYLTGHLEDRVERLHG